MQPLESWQTVFAIPVPWTFGLIVTKYHYITHSETDGKGDGSGVELMAAYGTHHPEKYSRTIAL